MRRSASASTSAARNAASEPGQECPIRIWRGVGREQQQERPGQHDDGDAETQRLPAPIRSA